MVKGLDRFKENFLGESDQYVLIGGVAAMHWLEQASLQARATKDLDIVLLVEAQRTGFYRKFWNFVQAGGYDNRRKSTGERVHYRFSHPLAFSIYCGMVLPLQNEDILPVTEQKD